MSKLFKSLTNGILTKVESSSSSSPSSCVDKKRRAPSRHTGDRSSSPYPSSRSSPTSSTRIPVPVRLQNIANRHRVQLVLAQEEVIKSGRRILMETELLARINEIYEQYYLELWVINKLNELMKSNYVTTIYHKLDKSRLCHVVRSERLLKRLHDHGIIPSMMKSDKNIDNLLKFNKQNVQSNNGETNGIQEITKEGENQHKQHQMKKKKTVRLSLEKNTYHKPMYTYLSDEVVDRNVQKVALKAAADKVVTTPFISTIDNDNGNKSAENDDHRGLSQSNQQHTDMIIDGQFIIDDDDTCVHENNNNSYSSDEDYFTRYGMVQIMV